MRKIEWDGEWIASLIEADGGSYLAPPIVFDADGNVVMGREVLAAIAASDVAVEHPVLRDYGPGDVAALEQKLAKVADQLGVPLGTL